MTWAAEQPLKAADVEQNLHHVIDKKSREAIPRHSRTRAVS